MKKSARKLIVAIIIAVAAIAAAAAATIAFLGHQQRTHSTAIADCQQSAKTLTTSIHEVKTVEETSKATASIAVQDVADPQTVNDLARLLKAPAPSVATCDPGDSTSRLRHSQEQNRTSAESLRRQTASIKSATQKVNDSKELKQIPAALQTEMTNGYTLYKGSNGNVEDQSVRDNLANALKDVSTLLENTNGTVTLKQYRDAKAKLDKAVETTNAALAQFEKDKAAYPCLGYVGTFPQWVDSMDGDSTMITGTQAAKDNYDNIVSMKVTVNRDCSMTMQTNSGSVTLPPDGGGGGNPQLVDNPMFEHTQGEVRWFLDTSNTWLDSFADQTHKLPVTYFPQTSASTLFEHSQFRDGDSTLYDWFQIEGGDLRPIFWRVP